MAAMGLLQRDCMTCRQIIYISKIQGAPADAKKQWNRYDDSAGMIEHVCNKNKRQEPPGAPTQNQTAAAELSINDRLVFIEVQQKTMNEKLDKIQLSLNAILRTSIKT